MLKFGEMLINEGVVTKDQLKQVLERQVVFGGRIGTNLVELGLVDEDELTRLLSKYLKIGYADTNELIDISDEAIQTITPEIANQYKIIPFKKDKKRLHVAMIDVRNVSLVDELRFKTGYDVIPYIVSEIRLLYALEKYYGVKRDLRYISVFDGFSEESEEEKDESAEIKRVKEAFLEVKDKSEIAGILINEARRVAARTALFVIKRDRLEGWVSRTLPVSSFSAEIAPGSVVADVLTKKHYYRGPLPNSLRNQELINLLEGTPKDCLLMPVMIRDRIVCILYADNGNGKVLSSNLNYLDKLASIASCAFEMLIIKKRIMDL